MEDPASIRAFVHEATQRFTWTWYACDANTPGRLGRAYATPEKLTREQHLERFLDTVESQQQSPPALQRFGEQGPFFKALRTFLAAGLDFTDDYMDIILSPAFTKATRHFVTTARRFDPAISLDDIFQASRNAWVMLGLQPMFGLPIEVTPAIFAYSMLYPYTDNYLDNPGIARRTKTSFNKRLSLRLTGRPVAPANSNEQMIFDLLAMIEGQYDRSGYPHIFDSLLAIHRAQAKSTRLLDCNGSLCECNALKISIEKGGASLLADGYLVAGSVTQLQADFLFGYGAYLQLADDLQDIQTDSDAGLSTAFVRASKHSPLDPYTNRTIHFGRAVFERLDGFDRANLNTLASLMKRSILLLIIEAVGSAGRFHSRSFAHHMQTYSPWRYSYLKKRRPSLAVHRASITRLLDEAAASEAA